jgi:putative hydrolase of the HAD superfamily
MNPNQANISALFLDIGGVLLTNGWDRNARKRASEEFQVDYGEMDERHHLTFSTYELGKISLEEYLDRVVFYEPRTFSREDFIEFMYAQSEAYPDMIELVRKLKQEYCLHVAVVSNEGRELTTYRIQKFHLEEFVDFFISSCFVQYRKPDTDIFRIALDVSQVPANEVAYIEDREMFVEIAAKMGLRSIRHQGYDTTRKALAELGLALVETGRKEHA